MRKEYSHGVLQEVADQYWDECRVLHSSLFTSGFENSNYLIETDRGKYVIKFFEGSGIVEDTILFEVHVMDICFRAGIKTPHVLTNRHGSLVTMAENTSAIVMGYIDGENMNKRGISDHIAQAVGQETGKMDVVLSSFQSGEMTRQQYEWDVKNFLMLESKLQYLSNEFDKTILRGIFQTYTDIQPIFNQLPCGLIHNDIALHNILVRDGIFKAIIDFSDMAFSPYIQNLAVPMSQMFFCYNWKPEQASLFVQAYKKHRPVSDAELALLYDLTCARFATVIIEFHYWNTVLCGQDKEREQTVRDFYGFLKRFLAFGRERFNKLVRTI